MHGFAYVVMYSIVTWSLIRLGLSITGQTKTVGKTRTKFFDAFLQCMDDVQAGKRQHPCIQ